MAPPKIVEFPEHDSSYIVMQMGVDPASHEADRIGSLSKQAYAHMVLVFEDFYGYRFRIRKNRYSILTDAPLVKQLMEEFPSLTVKKQACRAPGTIMMTAAKYLVFEDEYDAIQFRLRYA